VVRRGGSSSPNRVLGADGRRSFPEDQMGQLVSVVILVLVFAILLPLVVWIGMDANSANKRAELTDKKATQQIERVEKLIEDLQKERSNDQKRTRDPD